MRVGHVSKVDFPFLAKTGTDLRLDVAALWMDLPLDGLLFKSTFQLALSDFLKLLDSLSSTLQAVHSLSSAFSAASLPPVPSGAHSSTVSIYSCSCQM